MIQIRNVPESLHRKLKARAAQAGMSLSDYLRVEIERIAALPSMEEMLQRLRQLPPVHPRPTAAEIIRSERDRK
ncbi:MAG TPA: hypothetical protein VFW28_10930 [Micropepsaceae bacterium]|nr:hypothetical protein [Micropepsaceae bacterium]